MKSIQTLYRWAFVALLIAFFPSLSSGQQAGKAGGNALNFINTSGSGGQLGHLQNGNFGTFNPADRWIGIGNPTFLGAPLPVYGMRIQDSGQAATVSLNDNSGGALDFDLQWGPDADSKFHLNFINSPTSPTGITNIMTALPDGRVGIGLSSPVIGQLVVRSNQATGPTYAIVSENFVAAKRGLLAQGDYFGAYHRNRIATTGTPNLNVSRYGSYNDSRVEENRRNIGAFCVGDGAEVNIGVLGRALAELNEDLGLQFDGNYGVFGEAPTSSLSFAGYFVGNVNISGSLSFGSDRRLKENIAGEKDALGTIMSLRPTTYTFRTEGLMGQMNLAPGQQHGFIAQELETVLPELVGEASQMVNDEESLDPDNPNAKAPEMVNFKTVNYIGLIPILTAGIQEQQGLIESQQAELAATQEVNQSLRGEVNALRNELADLRAELGLENGNSTKSNREELGAANVLFQNNPNPFSTSTQIKFEIGSQATSASLLVFDMNGRQLKAYDGLERGNGSVTIMGNELEAGMYFYSLVVDGAEVATKRMILTR